MESAFDPGPIVIGELANPLNHVVYVIVTHLGLAQRYFPVREASLWLATQVKYYLQQIISPVDLLQRCLHIGRNHLKQGHQVIGYPVLLALFVHDRHRPPKKTCLST